MKDKCKNYIKQIADYKPTKISSYKCEPCKHKNECYKADNYEPKEDTSEKTTCTLGLKESGQVKCVEVNTEKPKSVEEAWSTDGICLGEVKEFWALNEKTKVHRMFTIQKGYEDNAFQTKKRAELERDRREVDYIMKREACLSRNDNSWKYSEDNHYNYSIYFYSNVEHYFYIGHDVISHLNTAYFPTESKAKACLDLLLEKYGDKRLCEIWGVK